MTFHQFWTGLTAEQKNSLAEQAHTSYVYLSQIAGDHRKASVKFARRLAAVSGLPLSAIRPDIWST